MGVSLNVLLVEDSEDDAKLVMRELKQGGYDVLSERVETAGAMRSALEARDWDVVISDYMMPQFTGLEALSIARESGIAVPFIIVSGTVGEEVAVDTIRAGATDYLLKDRLTRLATAVKRALREAAAARERARLAEVIDSLAKFPSQNPNPVIRVTPDGAILYANAAAQMHLAECDFGPGKCLPAHLLDALSGALGDTAITEVEIECSGRHFLFAVAPVTAEGYVNLYGRDITERQQSRAELGRTAEMLSEACRLGRLGWWEYDLATHSLNWSDTVYEIFKRDPALGPPSEREEAALYMKEDAERLRQLAVRLIEHGETYEADLTIVLPGGEEAYVHAIGRPLKDQAGAVIKAVGTVQDITQRISAEKRIRHLNVVLRGIRDVSQLITREKDAEKLIVEASRILTDARGFSGCLICLEGTRDGFAGASACAGNGFDKAMRMSREEWPACMEEAFKSPHVVAKGMLAAQCDECRLVECETRSRDALAVRIAHGEQVFGAMLVTLPAGVADPEEEGLLLELAGDLGFALNGIRAEAKVGELEEQFRQSQKLEAVGRLAGGVAHDFNNMLGAIIGYTDIMLREVKKDDPFHGDLTQVKRAAVRAADLTRQLLAFSRKQVLEPRVLDVAAVVKGIEQMLQRLIGEDIDLRTVLRDSPWRMRADPGQLEQVILNLAVNARDAMPEGGKITIEASNVALDEGYAHRHVSIPPGEYVLLAVSDTGCGMTDEVKSHLFEPFFTTKGQGKGTGLGLSMVYGIVKQSEGEILVYSEEGRGTTFKIYFPRVEAKADSVRTTVVGGELTRGTETILVAEDEELLRRLVVRILSALGYEVLAAANGGEAFLICQNNPGHIDLLVTDVVMPGMSGRQLAERLAEVRPGIKVLFTSGYTDDAIVRHGVLEAGTPFIQKPFSASDLAIKVRNVLDVAAAR